MSKTLSLVPYDRGEHESALLQLTDRVLGPEARARRQKVLDSFHDRMPGREREPLRHVYLDGDRAAGTLGYMPADFLVRGEIVPVRYTHDLFVDPSYALVGHRTFGKGLGTLLVENALRLGGPIPGGMWMTASCHKIHLASGFDNLGPLVTYSCVLDPDSFVTRRGPSSLKGTAARVGLAAVRLVALARARACVDREGDAVRAVRRFEATDDSVWMELARSYSLTRVRGAEYMNWKYMQHPLLDYRAFVAARDGRPSGYVVWRPAPAGGKETRAVIPDFLVERGDAATFGLLVARVMVDAAGSGCDAVAVMTTQPWAARALRGLGFLPGRTRSAWVVAGWKDVIPAEWLRTPEPWHVCLGDSDGDIWTGTM